MADDPLREILRARAVVKGRGFTFSITGRDADYVLARLEAAEERNERLTAHLDRIWRDCPHERTAGAVCADCGCPLEGPDDG